MPRPLGGAISDDAVWRLSVCLSDVCLSRTERPRKTKIGIEVGHVTRDSDTTLKVQKVKGQLAGGGGISWRPRAQLVNWHNYFPLITFWRRKWMSSTAHWSDCHVCIGIFQQGTLQLVHNEKLGHNSVFAVFIHSARSDWSQLNSVAEALKMIRTWWLTRNWPEMSGVELRWDGSGAMNRL